MTLCVGCNVEPARDRCQLDTPRCDRCCWSRGWSDAADARVCLYHLSTAGHRTRAEFSLPAMDDPSVRQLLAPDQVQAVVAPSADTAALLAVLTQLQQQVAAIESRLDMIRPPHGAADNAPSSPRPRQESKESSPESPRPQSPGFVDPASARYASAAAALAGGSSRFARHQGIEPSALNDFVEQILASKHEVSSNTTHARTAPASVVVDPFAEAEESAPRTREEIYDELATNSRALQKAIKKHKSVIDLLEFLDEASHRFRIKGDAEKALAMSDYRNFIHSTSADWKAPDSAVLAYHYAFEKAIYNPVPERRADLFVSARHQPSVIRHLLKFEHEYQMRQCEELHGSGSSKQKRGNGSASNSKAKRSSAGDCSLHPGKGHSDSDCFVQKNRAKSGSSSSSAKESGKQSA
jgi:hypothetical protein